MIESQLINTYRDSDLIRRNQFNSLVYGHNNIKHAVGRSAKYTFFCNSQGRDFGKKKKSVNKEEKPVTVSAQLQFSVSVYLLPL